MCLPSLRVSPRMEATSGVVCDRAHVARSSRGRHRYRNRRAAYVDMLFMRPRRACMWDLSIALGFFETKVFLTEHVSRTVNWDDQGQCGSCWS